MAKSLLDKKRIAADRRKRKKYGITQDEYDAMLKKQGGVCAICGGVPNHRVVYIAKETWSGESARGKTPESARTNLRKKLGRLLRGCKMDTVVTVNSLAVDHSHKFAGFKVSTRKSAHGTYWLAWMPKLPKLKPQRARTKNKAIRKVREIAKRMSVRGLVCFPCNGGIRKFRDNPRFLAAAAKYLFKHEKLLKEEYDEG